MPSKTNKFNSNFMPVIHGDGYYKDDSDSKKDSSSESSSENENKDSEETTSALLPKSILSGKEVEPGDKVILEVTHIFEDEFEVAYPKNGYKDKKSKPDKEESDMDMEDSMSKLDRMAMMSEEE